MIAHHSQACSVVLTNPFSSSFTGLGITRSLCPRESMSMGKPAEVNWECILGIEANFSQKADTPPLFQRHKEIKYMPDMSEPNAAITTGTMGTGAIVRPHTSHVLSP